MIVDVCIPDVGESITEGLLTEWLKADGDVVGMDEDLYELETDKVTMSVPAEAAGVLSISVPAKETVKVGQVVGKIQTLARNQTEALSDPAPSVEQIPEENNPLEGQEPVREPGPPVVRPAGWAQAEQKLSRQEVDLSPAVRRLVAQHQLAPGSIQATGKGGRLTKEDVVLHLSPLPKASEGGLAVSLCEPKTMAPGRETRRKMSPLRHRLTERLVQVQQTAAILTTFNEVDMSQVMAFRARHKEAFMSKFDVRLGFMSFFVKAVVDALKTVPDLNARIEGDEIISQHYYDIGVAVSTKQGLVVPVIRDADQMSFAGIEKDIAEKAIKARNKRLGLNELTGGVFTISNGGVYGSLLSTPILNPPQSGILGLHRIQKRAMVVADEMVIRPMMYLALSYDHRLVDGAEAVGFLKRIVECITDPERLFLEV
jgi:2-oxoglutarate dehydrogenase E2 component (dihydrolipoamide succinyltransferase)